jgi:hypothetical protein
MQWTPMIQFGIVEQHNPEIIQYQLCEDASLEYYCLANVDAQRNLYSDPAPYLAAGILLYYTYAIHIPC